MRGEVMADSDGEEFPVWRTPEGEPVSCVEKIKVLNENLAELREVLAGIVTGLVNPYGQ